MIVYGENVLMNRNKIKIIYLVRSLKICGPVNVLFSIVKNLDKSTFQPLVITFKSEESNSRINDFLHCGIQVYSEKNVFEGIKKIRSILKNNSEKLILHSHGILPDLVNLFFVKSKCHNISTIHSNIFEDYPMSFGKFEGSILATFHYYILKHLVRVSCSKSVHLALKKRTGLTSVTIRNGIEFKNYCDIKKNMTQLKRMYQPIKIIYIGSIIDRKNVKFLCEAVSKITDISVKLIIVGTGNQYQLLKKKYNSNSKIIFYGFKRDPSPYYKKADIITSASFSEGLSMTLLEALSYGKPLLLSKINSHQEIIESGKFGQLFINDDINSYIANLKLVCKSAYNSEKIYEEAKSIFSDKIMTQKYELLYRNNRL